MAKSKSLLDTLEALVAELHDFNHEQVLRNVAEDSAPKKVNAEYLRLNGVL